MLHDEIGQDAVLDRLLDLLLVAAVRAHLTRTAAEAPGWFRLPARARGEARPIPSRRKAAHRVGLATARSAGTVPALGSAGSPPTGAAQRSSPAVAPRHPAARAPSAGAGRTARVRL